MGNELEVQARAEADAGKHDVCAALGIQGYGEEVFAFLISRLRDEDVAGDVFSQACEDLLRSLAGFEWRCSLRTWFYRLARSAMSHHLRSPAARDGHRVALSQVSEVAQQVRSRTVAHLRSEVKDRVRALREQLAADEQTLLMLRVDRGLGWHEIAEILDDTEDGEAVARASARLRQQFQALKARLRRLAIADGLIDAD